MRKLTNKILDKKERFLRRKNRTNTISKTMSDLPRLIVNKSNKFTYAQIVDRQGNVISSANDLKLTGENKTQRAQKVGEAVAKKALEKGIDAITFDRNGNLYIGRVKALADGAREAGLKF